MYSYRVVFQIMNDDAALNFLRDKMGKDTSVAEALGVKPQVIWNWRKRGISADKRPHVWAMVNDRGGNLSRDWLLGRGSAA